MSISSSDDDYQCLVSIFSRLSKYAYRLENDDLPFYVIGVTYFDVLGELADFMQFLHHYSNITVVAGYNMDKKLINIPVPSTSPSISAEELKPVEPFYQGEYCDVYKIRKNGTQYAVKVIDLKRITSDFDQEFNRIGNQIRVLYSIKHPGVIQLLGHFQRDNLVGLIFPMFGQPIGKFIKEQKKKSRGTKLYTINNFIDLFRNIGSAIAQLHALGYIHRDISQDNVLIDSNLNTKLIDFGCIGNIEYSRGSFGTREYLAPQILEKKSYNHKVDVWSFGILCYELLYGVYMFRPRGKNLSDEEFDQMYLINMKQPIDDPPDQRILLDEKPQPELITLVKSMLAYVSDKRPQVGYLLSKKVFGAQDREALSYSIEEYSRQKTSRKSNKAQINLHSNTKQMSIRELQSTLFSLVQMHSIQCSKQKELFINLLKEEQKLCKLKYQDGLE